MNANNRILRPLMLSLAAALALSACGPAKDPEAEAKA